MRFRTAEGASHEGRDGSGHERFRVSIPFDEHGFFGRQCPSCMQIFRMHGEDYHHLPDDLQLTCPYCGHVSEHSEFMTEQQRDRVMQVARDAALQMVSDAFKGLSRRSTGSSRRGGVTVTFRSKPFYPRPLPGINEESLIRERRCETCGVRYAVFGEHRFCPVSGLLAPGDIAADALASEEAKLSALSAIPADQIPILREQGVFERINVDVLGRVVGAVEACASSVFRNHALNAEAALRGKGNVFQRLDDLAGLFRDAFGVELATVDGVRWPELVRLWAARHVHTHAGGLVDDRYLRAVPASRLAAGQRVVVTDADAHLAIQQARLLCDAITLVGGTQASVPSA
ncbi:MAG: hypothetical protein D3X82_04565 [Candidatus Leucobacter sulfamidivorax]|nr:hypothetical protein [Candidatus Leucobacter sulfamidivorax]